MANKRYDQFPAGAYNTAKIFLQADSATGALEKINLPSADTLLPGQVGNTGKFLQTNGTTTSWATALTSVDTSANYTWTGLHTFNNSINGAGGSTILTPTITSTVSGQVLSALNITPTFHTSGFPTTSLYGLMINNAGFYLSNTKFDFSAAERQFVIDNPTPATASVQQPSPPIILSGQGWASTPAQSQPVRWAIYNNVITGAATPSGELVFAFSVNNATYTNTFKVTTSGIFSATFFQASNSVAASNQVAATIVQAGTSTFSGFTYKLTSAGGAISPWLACNNQVATSGTLFMAHDGTNQLMFGSRNSATAAIINASIALAIISSTSGSEAGDLTFKTQSGGTAVSEKMRLTSTGTLLINATSANASALLQIDSTTKGFLPTRMTTAQKNAIASPGEGLFIYDTTLHKLCVFTGSAWETITSS